MAYLAEAFDTGLNLGSDREQCYSQVLLFKVYFFKNTNQEKKLLLQALSWYLLAGRAGADRACCLLARAAEIFLMEDAGELGDDYYYGGVGNGGGGDGGNLFDGARW